MFKPVKSMVGSDNIFNVAWTAPTLMALGWYMNHKLGSLTMTKFFFLSFASFFIFQSAFNPQTGLNIRPLKGILPKFDSFADDGSYYMGADQMAQSILYLTLFYHRLWFVALPLMGLDLLYYGPATLGGLVAPIIGSLIFL